MNPAMFIAVIYLVFSIFVIYIAARPSNRKRVLRWSLGDSASNRKPVPASVCSLHRYRTFGRTRSECDSNMPI